jgi:Tn3 transposase DDE domain
MACEHLKSQHLLRPGVTILERLVITARTQAHHESLRRLQPLLTPNRAREGMVTQKYEEGQTNQAACLNLLTNAVIVWNTVYMQAALEALRHEGYPVHEEDLAHLWPTRFAHVHRYGKYQFDVKTARARAGLRPLQR